MTADSIVKARIDAQTKEKAAAALGKMGLSISAFTSNGRRCSSATRNMSKRMAAEAHAPRSVQRRLDLCRFDSGAEKRTLYHLADARCDP